MLPDNDRPAKSRREQRDEGEERRSAVIGHAGCLHASGAPRGHHPTRTVPAPSSGRSAGPVPARSPSPRVGSRYSRGSSRAPGIIPRPDHIVSIRGAGCQDLLRLSPDDRAAASMFYIGYQASRLRARTINVGRIPSIEAQAVTYCEENPRRTVADVFAEAFVRSRK